MLIALTEVYGLGIHRRFSRKAIETGKSAPPLCRWWPARIHRRFSRKATETPRRERRGTGLVFGCQSAGETRGRQDGGGPSCGENAGARKEAVARAERRPRHPGENAGAQKEAVAIAERPPRHPGENAGARGWFRLPKRWRNGRPPPGWRLSQLRRGIGNLINTLVIGNWLLATFSHLHI